jgi:hypothetical protein
VTKVVPAGTLGATTAPPVISQNVHSKSAAAAGAIVLCIEPFGARHGRREFCFSEVVRRDSWRRPLAIDQVARQSTAVPSILQMEYEVCTSDALTIHFSVLVSGFADCIVAHGVILFLLMHLKPT